MKFLVTSTKITTYEDVFEADSLEHLEQILSELIEDDFTPMHGEWLPEEIVEITE